MNWSREISGLEYLFIAIFIILYGYYIIKVIKVARSLGSSSNSVFIKFFIRTLYFSFLLIALLGPNFGVSEQEARSAGKEIYLAVDLSNSMNATDVEPSRLEKAKQELIILVENLKADKVGLLIFNSDASIITPLTYDLEILKNQISSLKTSLLENGTTDYNALFSLLNDKFNTDDAESNRVCVMVSDGENFENIDDEQLKKLKSQNIHLIFLGIGTAAGGKIPDGIGFKKDKAGEEVITKLDLKQMAFLSSKTEGSYFVINNETNQLSKMMDYLNILKSKTNNTEKILVAYNKYVYFLLAALLLIICDFLLSIKIIKI